MDSKSLHYINKQTLKVEIETATHKIEGHVHVIYNHRSSDMLNSKENFIAVTDAAIKSKTGDENVINKDFIAVNKAQIIFLTEIETPRSPQQDHEQIKQPAPKMDFFKPMVKDIENPKPPIEEI